MRVISTIFIAIAFALCANAEAEAIPEIPSVPETPSTKETSTKPLPEAVVSCYKDITSAVDEFYALGEVISALKEGDGYDKVHHGKETVESHLKSAGINCCKADTSDFTEDEGVQGVDLITTYSSATDYVLILAQLMKEGSTIDAEAQSQVSKDIASLSEQNDALFACFEKNSPAAYLKEVETFKKYVKESYDTAKAAFAPQE